jgi:hypothetical protein
VVRGWRTRGCRSGMGANGCILRDKGCGWGIRDFMGWVVGEQTKGGGPLTFDLVTSDIVQYVKYKK